MSGVTIIGTGHYVPGEPVLNDALARVMETSDDWIRERSGIVERRYVEAGVGASVLGIGPQTPHIYRPLRQPDGTLLGAGAPRGLYVLRYLGADAPGTDDGWTYGTIDADDGHLGLVDHGGADDAAQFAQAGDGDGRAAQFLA